MATYPATGGKDFTPVAAGTHLAVCTLIADVGLQPGSGKYPDPKVLIYMRFEIPGERVKYEKDGVEHDAPAIVYNNYAAFMSPKANLRKAIESWRAAKFTDAEAELFDVRKLLGQTCMLLVVHSDDGKYANVKNIMAPMKGQDGKKPSLKPEGKVVYYGPDDDSQYADLPAFLQKKVDEQLNPEVLKRDPPPMNQPGPQRQARAAEAASKAAAFEPGHDFSDEIPFAQRGKRSHWE